MKLIIDRIKDNYKKKNGELNENKSFYRKRNVQQRRKEKLNMRIIKNYRFFQKEEIKQDLML